MLRVVVIGAGPAGMSAATWAGVGKVPTMVTLIDENDQPGGNIWRSERGTVHPKVRFLARAGGEVRVKTGETVIDAPAPGVLTMLGPKGAYELEYDRLILATGARERFLPFPGWTLPGVCGAGGLQAMVKGGLDVRGKRIVLGGTGPLLLAVAAALRKEGAKVVRVVEQTPFAKATRFGARHAPFQGAALLMRTGPLRYRCGQWVVRAEGSERLEAVVVSDGTRETRLACDLAGIGYGLVPNLELPKLLGCEIEHGFVKVDDKMQTSVPNVFAAGELLGIGGAEIAAMDGMAAALGAVQGEADRPLTIGARTRARIAEAFALRPELAKLPDPDTIVCRCEGVRWRDLAEASDWTTAKLQTRCGMGVCQGRVCGAAMAFLRGVEPESVRPPLTPVPIRAMMDR